MLALADKNSQISKKRGRSIANCGPFVAAYIVLYSWQNFDGVLFFLLCLFFSAGVSPLSVL